MKITPRVGLVRVDSSILSSYPIGKSRDKLTPLADLDFGYMTPKAAAALLSLHKAVTAAGADFRVTEANRLIETQAKARAKYEKWVAAGKPKQGTAAFDSKTMKAAYVAEPGYSFHNAGSAIDNDTGACRFPGVADNLQLDRMWEIARPLGWRPAIKEAKEGSSESWHYDYLGDWAGYYDRTKDYALVAMCACLDVGVAVYGRDAERMLQAQLQRAGFDCGTIDGMISTGGKTEKALVAAGFAAGERDYTKLFALPTR